MRKIAFFLICISLICTGFANTEVSEKNTKLTQAEHNGQNPISDKPNVEVVGPHCKLQNMWWGVSCAMLRQTQFIGQNRYFRQDQNNRLVIIDAVVDFPPGPSAIMSALILYDDKKEPYAPKGFTIPRDNFRIETFDNATDKNGIFRVPAGFGGNLVPDINEFVEFHPFENGAMCFIDPKIQKPFVLENPSSFPGQLYFDLKTAVAADNSTPLSSDSTLWRGGEIRVLAFYEVPVSSKYQLEFIRNMTLIKNVQLEPPIQEKSQSNPAVTSIVKDANDGNTKEVKVTYPNETSEERCTEGIFTFEAPFNLKKIQGARAENLKSQMMQGGRELAEASRTADPNLFTKSSLTFFSAYELAGGDFLFILMGVESPVEMNRDEMFNANSERIRWGKDSGQLSSESKGVSKLDIDGIPSLLMDIVSSNGERMQTYTFFIPDHPKHSFAIAFKSTGGKNQATIDGILSSLKIGRAKSSIPKPTNLLPAFSDELQGSNPVRVRNPNDFGVATGLRSGGRGVNFDVPANGEQTVYVPNGKYDIYFVYSDKPDGLFQGDSFTLNNNGVEIQIVQVVSGNYNIRQVK
jgi:hypothetical protein